MNIYSLPPLFTALIALYLGCLVFSKNKKSSINFTFFLLCLCTFWWQSSWFILFNTKDKVLAYFLVKIGYSGIIFISITFFHFVVKFLGGGLKKFIIANYLIGFLFLIVLWVSKYFVNGFYEYFWGFYPKASLLHPFHLIQLFVMTLAMIFILIRYIKIFRAQPIRYNQMKYILIAIGAYFPAASDYIVNYGIEFYPLGFIFVLSSISIFAYAIVRHHLMDIEVILKKSLVFAGMFAFVFGIVVGVAMLIAQLLGGANNLLTLAISVLIIIFTLRPIETWLINITDKFLFQKKYEYKQIIQTFIDEVITELNLDKVINSTLKLLDETLHPYTSAVFILNKVEDKYQLYNAYGLESSIKGRFRITICKQSGYNQFNQEFFMIM